MMCYIVFGLLCALVLFVIWIVRSPYKYPKFVHQIDISRRRNPDIDICARDFLCNGGMINVNTHKATAEAWEKVCKDNIGFPRKIRERQLNECIAGGRDRYIFDLVRVRTRYKQVNHVRSSYKVNEVSFSKVYSYDKLKEMSGQGSDPKEERRNLSKSNKVGGI